MNQHNFNFYEGKTVYLCCRLWANDPETLSANAEAARACAEYFSSEYGCRAIAPQGYLPFLLRNEPEERAFYDQWCLQLLSLCDTLVIVGECLTEEMKREIDFAQEQGITVVTRPESMTAYVAYNFEKRHRAAIAAEQAGFVSIGQMLNGREDLAQAA